MLLERLRQRSLIDTARCIARNTNHIGCGLAPGQLIGVMFVGTNEHQCAGGFFIGGVGELGVTWFQAEQVHQRVHGTGRTGATKDQRILRARVNHLLDRVPGPFPELSGMASGMGRLRVCVGVMG